MNILLTPGMGYMITLDLSIPLAFLEKALSYKPLKYNTAGVAKDSCFVETISLRLIRWFNL